MMLFCPNSFMQLVLKIISGVANSVDPDQTAETDRRKCLICVSTVFKCHFIRNFGV